MKTIKCAFCGKEKNLIDSRAKKEKYCSVKCANKHQGLLGIKGGDRSSLAYLYKIYDKKTAAAKYKQHGENISKTNTGRPSKLKGTKWNGDKNKMSMIIQNTEYHKNIKNKDFDDIYGSGAKQKLSKRMKGVFTLSWFIKKYGDSQGKIKYQERIDNIKSTTYFKKYNKTNKNNYSKISQELFWKLYKELNLKEHKVYFAELNHEYGCGTCKNFDFVDNTQKKVIEYHGDNFHANPKFFEENAKPHPYNKEITAKEMWLFDKNKQNAAIKKGYKIIEIWHSDYLKDAQGVINKCKKFLND